MLPKSLLVVLALLVVIFFFSMIRTIQANKKKYLYRRLADGTGSTTKRGGGSVNSRSIPPISSYQDSAAVHYALPNQQRKDITYCVVDGRLVDDR